MLYLLLRLRMEVQKEELTEHADVDVEPGTVATIMAVFVNIMLFLTFFNLKKNNNLHCYYYSVPGWGVEYCEHVCVCLCVCLSAGIYPELHGQCLLNFLCMLPMALVDSVAIRYALPVIWMTSYLHIHVIYRNRQCEKGIYSKCSTDLTSRHIPTLTHKRAALNCGIVRYLICDCFVIRISHKPL